MAYLLYLSFVLWACTSGIIDAILYSLRGSNSFVWNEHIPLTIQRILTAIIALIAAHTSIHSLPIIFISCLLSFSFFHNGLYYETRNRIDSPLYNFTSNSATSTSIIQFNFASRSISFIIGLVILFLTEFLCKKLTDLFSLAGL